MPQIIMHSKLANILNSNHTVIFVEKLFSRQKFIAQIHHNLGDAYDWTDYFLLPFAISW